MGVDPSSTAQIRLVLMVVVVAPVAVVVTTVMIVAARPWGKIRATSSSRTTAAGTWIAQSATNNRRK